MIRIVALSDTHGRIAALEAAAPQIRAMKPDMVVHLGDGARDADHLETLLGMPVIKLSGNCDFAQRDPDETQLQAEGLRVLATHGHLFGVKTGLLRLALRAQQEGCDVALYGHTHIARIEESGGVLLVNPGAMAAARLEGRLGIAVVEVQEGRAKAALL